MAYIDDFEFMVPRSIWSEGDEIREAVSSIYLDTKKYIELAKEYLTVKDPHPEIEGVHSEWYPLWLEIKEGGGLFFEISFQLTGDDCGIWIVVIKDEQATSHYYVCD